MNERAKDHTRPHHKTHTWVGPILLLCGLMLAVPSVEAAPKPGKAATPPKKRAKLPKGWQWSAIQTLAKSYGQFPQVTGETLASTKRTLPGGFPGKVTFVILSFARAHQKPLQTWLPHLEQLRKKYKGFDYLSMPLMGGFARIFGGVIKQGMRGIYKTQDSRLRLMPMFTDKGKIIKSCRVRSTNEIAVMLVDQKGRIFWQLKGAKSAYNVQSLSARLKSLYR